MKQVFIKPLLIGSFLFCAWGQLAAQNQKTIESIVAVVEEDVILRSELDKALGAVLQQLQANKRPLPARNVLEKQVLDQLIMIKLQLQRADATGIRVSDEDIDRSIERVAAQAGLTVDRLRRTVSSEQLSWQEFRQDMADEIKATRLRQRVANSRVNITETEVDLFLANQSGPQGEYKLSHILIGVPEGASPAQVEQSRQKAEDVHQKIRDGLDFTTAAITYSDGQQALQGGDLGWRSADQVPLVFANIITDMSSGEVSKPIRNASGFHIVKVNEFREEAQRMVQEYKANHIMVEVSELVTTEEAREIIVNLHERIGQGENFSELAKQFSDDTTSANLGGDMGWFEPTRFGERVKQVLDTLSDNQISQPFQTPQGWHILEKIGERQLDRTEDFIRAQARENIRQQKATEELELFMRQMRDESYIEYRIATN